jgi:Ca2+-binding RTX toxin-like protein
MASFTPDLENKNPTNGDDVLFGSSGYDQIFGKNGADNISGLGGNDELYGESQDDTLSGGTGDDFIHGGSGDDTLRGDDGNDTLDGSTNDDFLYGGGEDDYLTGGQGRDHLFGGGENDIIVWANGDGNDVVDGGSGSDTLSLETADEFGGSSFTGERFLLNRDGVDAIFQRTSENPFNVVLSSTENIELFTRGGADTLQVEDLTGTGVESIRLFGGDGSERVASSGFTPLTIYGEGGSDFLTGGLGDDTIFGGERGDRIGGGEGNDYLDGGIGDDTVTGGAGNDTIYGDEGNDGLVGGPGNDELIGAGGSDQFRYDLPPTGGGEDIIQDFFVGVDDLFLGGITQAQLDTNGNSLLDDGDGRVSFIDTDLVIDFGANNTLSINGVSSLGIGTDVFFI